METFSVKRKADRALMAKKLTDIGRVYGAIPEVSEEGSCSATRRYTHVKIKHPSGLCAMVALDGASANHSFHGETFCTVLVFTIAFGLSPVRPFCNRYKRHRQPLPPPQSYSHRIRIQYAMHKTECRTASHYRWHCF